MREKKRIWTLGWLLLIFDCWCFSAMAASLQTEPTSFLLLWRNG